MPFMKAGDTISGSEARGYTTIKGLVEEMYYAKKVNADVEKSKKSIKTLGKRGAQHKTTGWEGKGTMTIYYVTTMFRQMMLDYIKNGIDTYFDMQIVNEDPTSSIGKQTVVLKGVNLDKVVMASFDLDADNLEEEIQFTFEDVDILDSFGKPVLG